MSISLIPELTQIPQDETCVRYLLARVVAPRSPAREGRLPVHLSLVLDRSGSMEGTKIGSARRAAVAAMNRLSPTDRFSVVFYDNQVDVVVPSTLATPGQRKRAATIVSTVQPRDTTDLAAGWMRGCEEVARHLPEGAVGRVLLLTDGLANVGITSVQELEQHAAAFCARGVTTSTFGMGEDFDDELLRKMSSAGGGAFYFIERPEQIEDYMTSETGDALDVVVRNVRLHVRFPDGVRVRCRSLWPTETSEGTLDIRLGNLLSDQQLDVLLELEIPAGADACPVWASLVDADGAMAAYGARIELTRVERVEVQADPTVAGLIVDAIAAEGRSRGMEAMLRGEGGEAARLFEEAAVSIERYAPVLARARGLAGNLRAEASKLEDMSAMARKRLYMMSSSASRGRSEDGYAVKGVREEVGLFTDVEMVLAHTWVPEQVSDRVLFLPLSAQDAHIRSGRVLDPPQEADCVDMYRGRYAHLKMCFVFVAARLHDDQASHWHPDARTAVVSVAGVSPFLLEAFVGYQVLLRGLHLRSPGYDPARLAHADTRGCLFDLCELGVKLQTLNVCPTCAEALQELDIDVDSVREACGLVRGAALEHVPS